MKLIHTLLMMVRKEASVQDMDMFELCLKSLEQSTYHSVVIYNQGYLTNEELNAYLKAFSLDCVVIGDGSNIGIVAGRQRCFSHIFENFPETKFISELHADMVFTPRWEDALVAYLEENEDEPVIGCGIVSDASVLAFFPDRVDEFLAQYKSDRIERGFAHPCIHKAQVLRAVGGYDTRFLTGKHAFEDDSLLLGYHYYYGTRANWVPKINYNSVAYHATGAQRFSLTDSTDINFSGLVSQYGAMGVRSLSNIHVNPWQKQFFTENFNAMVACETVGCEAED